MLLLLLVVVLLLFVINDFIGLFDVILEYVLGQRLSDSQDHEKILSKCFTFLQRVARKNKRVCHRQYTSIANIIRGFI